MAITFFAPGGVAASLPSEGGPLLGLSTEGIDVAIPPPVQKKLWPFL